ncbi:flagellar basal body rod protein FlgB [Acetatifactor aquisgranensis]|uniref:flagellar basal body rod protein FlgB n=1 Tax=Acetatifactor aquisgranensis TaxID=2941233 RepID=UPI00203D2058|nr:flagellar basal body rod protein FlgB [Acetatifactor aquisgranensis]MCI8543292.1 flagellar basal body rod protein FlgB [Lachnospiraceae bacterium]
MFQSNVFDYVNVLDRAADASWMRNEAIGNNLSNVDTPGYKRQDVAFEDVLKQALGRSSYRSMDAKVSSLNLKRLEGRVYTDHASFSYRVDGNNVDPDTEGVMLAQNQLKYQGLITSINQEFTNLQTVMK